MSHDVIDVTPKNAQNQSLVAWGWVSYLLHLVVAVAAVIPGAQVSVALLLLALLIDLFKRGDAQGNWHQSHFSWRIRSVVWAAILYVVTIPGFLLGLFFFNPFWVLISIWFLYRIIRGMLAMNREQPVGA